MIPSGHIIRPAPATDVAGWRVHALAEVDSTQRFAAPLPAWSAVLAARQTGGRGQRERLFASDPGGLYLTAVVPFDGNAAQWRGFALAVGWALRHALLEAEVSDLRLRWPNDLMIGSRKIGGILIEQGGAQTLLIGLGLNITNQPWLSDPALQDVAGRLLDYSGRALTGPAQLLEPVLRAIRLAHEEFGARRLAGMASLLNLGWGPPRRVSLEPAGGIELLEKEGTFAGIDETGHVLLARPDGSILRVPEHHIQRLVELE
ncbi:MAG: biotin--[acetyl-CoA-carboxylase] ligase [Lacunisphaera sp.]|nr:biotin--[acetyl-CoA-carboxylase] ligase [Lacunisphaera sp.]